MLFYNIINYSILSYSLYEEITQFPLKNNQRVAKNIVIYEKISRYFTNIAVIFKNSIFFDDSIRIRFDISISNSILSIFRYIESSLERERESKGIHTVDTGWSWVGVLAAVTDKTVSTVKTFIDFVTCVVHWQVQHRFTQRHTNTLALHTNLVITNTN